MNAVGAWRKGGRGTDIRRVSLENLDVEARNFCHIYYRYGRECVFEDLAFRHVRGKVSGPSVIEDTSDRPFRNLVFEDVALEGETAPRVLETASGQQQREAVASVGFGGGLTISAPPLVTEDGGDAASATFVPWSFDSNWKPHGASGAPGAGFVIECSPATENAADFRNDLEEMSDQFLADINTPFFMEAENDYEMDCDYIEFTPENLLKIHEDILTMNASKRYEQKVMNMIPFGIILYMNFSSPEFLSTLYTTLLGRITMTGCLAVYILAIYLAERIMRIEV